MNKVILSIVVVAIIAIALGTAGAVYAQAGTPQASVTGTGYGYGMGAGRGNRGGMNNGGMGGVVAGTQDGLLHDEMIATFAEKLEISVDDLNERLAAGETVAEIAIAEGLTVEQFSALRVEVRTQVLDQAVKDGLLTQEQADWMKTRGAGNGAGRGMRGNGQGQFGNADCPYLQTNP